MSCEFRYNGIVYNSKEEILSVLNGETDLQQLEGTESSKASEVTLNKVKEFLSRIGVDIKDVQGIVVNGQKVKANAISRIMQNLIEVVDGKEDVALTEEAMHFAVELLEKYNSSLYKEMFNKIGQYGIFKDTMHDYRDTYKTEDGKPDVPKIKKEAIAKLLTEQFIRLNEGITEKPDLLAFSQGIWDRIKQWLRSLFSKSTYNPFEEAAKQINTLSGSIEGSTETFFLQANKDLSQKDIADKILAGEENLVKLDDGKGNSHYEKNGKTVKNRVTDIAKGWYARIFKAGEIGKTVFQKALDDTKRDKGTDIHADLEDIQGRLVDPTTHLLRDVELPQTSVSRADPNDNTIYETLETNLRDRLNSFPKGTMFFAEKMIYDAKKDEAGTIDFIAIDPEGVTHVLDWKSLETNEDKYDDIPWYKVDAWRKQIDEYVRILEQRYGIKKFGQRRAIPIQTKYEYIDSNDKKKGIQIKGIKIGNVNAALENDNLLLPVGTKEETTGNAKIDEAIRKLNFVYESLSARPVKGGRKDVKAAQLNSLFTAIRQLQIKGNMDPLLEQGKLLLIGMDDITFNYNTNFKGKDPNSIDKQARIDFADELKDAMDELKVYGELDVQFNNVFDPTDADQKELIDEVGSLASDARRKLDDLRTITKEYTSNFIAGRVGIKDFLNKEQVVRGAKKLFRTYSQGTTKAIKTLYRLETPLRHQAEIKADEENKRLDKIKEEYDKWAGGKNLNPRNYFDLITKKDKKGRYVHQQIDKFNPDFYTQFNEKAKEIDKDWVRDNVDIDAYVKHYEDFLIPNKLTPIDTTRYSTNDVENEERKKREREKFHNQYSLSRDTAWVNSDLKKFPAKKWESVEWKELDKKGNEPAMALYSYINGRMKQAAASGAIEEKRANRLLPFMRKSTIEKLAFGGKIRLGEDFLRSITADEDDTVYGERDIETGEIKPTIPFYFVRDIGRDVYDDKGNLEYTDYSDVSSDLFKLMKLFNDQMYVYEYRTEIESEVQLLLTTERLKESIQTSRWGNIQKDNGKPIVNPTNEKNAEHLERFVKNRLYGQKYVDSDGTDIAVGRIAGDAAKKINKFFHAEILPEDMGDKVVSITKLLDTMNRFFQQKVLGLNVSVPLSNLVGGNVQVLINSGRYMNKTDFGKAWLRFTSQKFTGEEGEKYAGLMDYFLPLLDNERYRKARESSVSAIAKFSMSDFLMSIQRGSDKMVQYPLAIALMENTMIEDGKFINIVQHVRSQNNYDQRYEPGKNRKTIEEKVEKEIEELKSTRSLPRIAKIVNDKLVIPGVARDGEAVANFREFIQQQGKNAVGNATPEDPSQIKMNAITNSFMVFKNWIPRLADVRIGELRYQEGTQSWEYGRMRMMAKVLFSNVLKGVGRVRNILVANEKGIEFLREMYETKRDKWLASTGEELELTEGQFIDLFREGIANEMKELGFLISLLTLVFVAKSAAPDPDEANEVKGFYKWGVRALDKISQELSFYYLPTTIEQVANGSIFPALGILTDISSVVKHQALQTYGFVMDDEGIQKAAHPQKYWMKTFPVTKELTTYIAIFNKEMGDNMGIQLSTQARSR